MGKTLMTVLDGGLGERAFVDRMLTREEGMLWDLRYGRVGVETEKGVAGWDFRTGAAVYDRRERDAQRVPAFSVEVEFNEIKEGNFLVEPCRGWVISRAKGRNGGLAFRVMPELGGLVLAGESGDGELRSHVMEDAGGGGYRVVRELSEFLPGGFEGVASLRRGVMQLVLLRGLLGGGVGLDVESKEKWREIWRLLVVGQLDTVAVLEEGNAVGVSVNGVVAMLPMLLGGSRAEVKKVPTTMGGTSAVRG